MDGYYKANYKDKLNESFTNQAMVDEQMLRNAQRDKSVKRNRSKSTKREGSLAKPRYPRKVSRRIRSPVIPRYF